MDATMDKTEQATNKAISLEGEPQQYHEGHPSIKRTGKNVHTVSLLVADKPGVLVRIALVFSRRGYNVESLVVSPAAEKGFSRMTITVVGNHGSLDQIIRQLNKLIDVIHATEHVVENIVEKELALIKINAPEDLRPQIFMIVDHFKAKSVDLTEDTISLEIVGNSHKLDAFLTLVHKFGIIELVRTGKVWMTRGSDPT
jgi:acetolactate synthase-1/3 small subunit